MGIKASSIPLISESPGKQICSIESHNREYHERQHKKGGGYSLNKPPRSRRFPHKSSNLGIKHLSHCLPDQRCRKPQDPHGLREKASGIQCKVSSEKQNRSLCPDNIDQRSPHSEEWEIRIRLSQPGPHPWRNGTFLQTRALQESECSQELAGDMPNDKTR